MGLRDSLLGRLHDRRAPDAAHDAELRRREFRYVREVNLAGAGYRLFIPGGSLGAR